MLSIAGLLTGLNIFACPACEIAQPRYLRGITHGTGPQSNWDFLIISFTAVIVIVTLFLSIKWLVKPGEKSVTHIKHLVLNID
ncbi:hypothetical protein BH11BAC5_BH11BAC5_10820 [soil metagenome]